MSGLAPRLREAETDEFPHSLACDDDTLRTDVEVDEPLDVVQVRQRIGHLQHTGQLSLLSSVEHTTPPPSTRRRLSRLSVQSAKKSQPTLKRYISRSIWSTKKIQQTGNVYLLDNHVVQDFV